MNHIIVIDKNKDNIGNIFELQFKKETVIFQLDTIYSNTSYNGVIVQ